MWVLFTFIAAFMQAWRNAFQSQLSQQVKVAGVTLSRFIWAGPIAVLYLAGLYYYQPVQLPEFNQVFFSVRDRRVCDANFCHRDNGETFSIEKFCYRCRVS